MIYCSHFAIMGESEQGANPALTHQTIVRLSPVPDNKNITKKCKCCGIAKSLTEMVKSTRTKSGYGSTCKTCDASRSRVKDRIAYAANILESRRHGRDRYHSQKGSYSTYEKSIYNRPSYRARIALRCAINAGKITKPATCSNCHDRFSSNSLHGHHSDYSNPLDVQWLCSRCHGLIHRKKDVGK